MCFYGHMERYWASVPPESHVPLPLSCPMWTQMLYIISEKHSHLSFVPWLIYALVLWWWYYWWVQRPLTPGCLLLNYISLYHICFGSTVPTGWAGKFLGHPCSLRVRWSGGGLTGPDPHQIWQVWRMCTSCGIVEGGGHMSGCKRVCWSTAFDVGNEWDLKILLGGFISYTWEYIYILNPT